MTVGMGRINTTVTTVALTAGVAVVLFGLLRVLQFKNAKSAAGNAAAGKEDVGALSEGLRVEEKKRTAAGLIPLKERIAVIRTLVTMSAGSTGHGGLPFAIVPELQHEAALAWRLKVQPSRRSRMLAAPHVSPHSLLCPL